MKIGSIGKTSVQVMACHIQCTKDDAEDEYAKDDEEESELDCGGYLPCSMLGVTLWRGYTCHAVYSRSYCGELLPCSLFYHNSMCKG